MRDIVSNTYLDCNVDRMSFEIWSLKQQKIVIRARFIFLKFIIRKINALK